MTKRMLLAALLAASVLTPSFVQAQNVIRAVVNAGVKMHRLAGVKMHHG